MKGVWEYLLDNLPSLDQTSNTGHQTNKIDETKGAHASEDCETKTPGDEGGSGGVSKQSVLKWRPSSEMVPGDVTDLVHRFTGG